MRECCNQSLTIKTGNAMLVMRRKKKMELNPSYNWMSARGALDTKTNCAVPNICQLPNVPENCPRGPRYSGPLAETRFT